MPYSTVSSVVSITRKTVYFTVRVTCPPILKSPKPFKNFISNVFPLCTEYNWRQTEFLSNFSSSLHTSSLLLVQSYFNTLIYVKFADESSFASVDTSDTNFVCISHLPDANISSLFIVTHIFDHPVVSNPIKIFVT